MEDHVASPTFTLVKEYAGSLDVAHVDVYRLERVQDVVDLGLDELGGRDRVLLVEWGDVVEELLPEDRLRVELTTEPTTTPVGSCSHLWGDRGRCGGNGLSSSSSPSAATTRPARSQRRRRDRRGDRDLHAAHVGGDRL